MRTKLSIFILSVVLVWSNLSAEEKKASEKDLSNTDLKFYTGTFKLASKSNQVKNTLMEY